MSASKEIPPVARSLETYGPDDSEGFSEFLLKNILSTKEFNDFKRWIRHQTIKIHASVAIYYIDDVMRWAYGMERWRVETSKAHG